MTNNNNNSCAICGNPIESEHWKALYCDNCKELPDGKFAVYGLYDDDNVIRYIGSTKNPMRRLLQHRTAKDKRNKIMWLWLSHDKENIKMKILAIVDKKQRRRAEELHIRRYRQLGHPLLNERQATQQPYTKEEKQAMLRRRFSMADNA